MGKKLTKEEFIKKAREIHGDKYDYSKVEYINNGNDIAVGTELDFYRYN